MFELVFKMNFRNAHVKPMQKSVHACVSPESPLYTIIF